MVRVVAAAVALVALAAPPVAAAEPLFRTPGQAAYCAIAEANLAPENPVLKCWTPNDGFTVTVAHDATPQDARNAYVRSNRGRTPRRGYRVLRFGETYRWRCARVTAGFAERCSGEGRTVFRCESRRSGLTCKNRDGHGFWLGRYVGYRIF